MADPQHPAVPFEQAVDLLTGEPRQLRPQHPDIAALVERLETREHYLVHEPRQQPHTPTTIALLQEAAAALRTVARPVEDEEVGPLLTRAKIELAWDDPAVRGAVRIPGKPTPNERPFPKWLATKMCDALARLARERDHLHRAHVLAAEDAARRLEQATRAEQEAARLRLEIDKLADDLASYRQWNGPALALRVRALAAAAGAEEPR